MLEYPLLCRLCGLKTENGLYIYCDEGKRRQVETKIRLYLHFQVLPSDSLPKKICASCFEELEGMHRFAINALKVQDNLARLSKELPMTAIDVCKSFSINYTDHAMAVSDTIASLNSEEVTEMEVQVDPMVFLEDDQIDDQDNQDSQDNQENQNNQENQENQDITQHLEQGAIAAVEGGHLNLQHNEHTETGKNEEALTSNADDSSKLVSSENDQEKDQAKSTINQNEVVDTHSHQRKLIPQICENAKADKDHTVGDSKQGVQQGLQEQQQPPPDEVAKIEANGRNGNLTGAPDKQHLTLPDVAAPLEPGEIRREKKGMVVIKNSKKIESKSTSTENIKCTTYTCPICKKVVMKKGLFKAHLETHKTDHKFACEICMRVFKKEINLIRHRKSHSELTTYPCAHCNRVYPTKSTLRSHLVSHSDERPHVCSICSKSFKRNQDLKFHLNQHNGLRPYRCPYCTKAFASSGNCFSHRRRAHMKEIERDRALKKSDESAN